MQGFMVILLACTRRSFSLDQATSSKYALTTFPQCAAILQLLSSKDQALLVRRDARVILHMEAVL